MKSSTKYGVTASSALTSTSCTRSTAQSSVSIRMNSTSTTQHSTTSYITSVRTSTDLLQISVSPPPPFLPHLFRCPICTSLTASDNLEHTPTHALHRRRGRALDPYFTKPAVQALHPLITSAISDLRTHLHIPPPPPPPPPSISLLARCFTIDVVTEYIFAQPFNFLRHAGGLEGSKGFLGAQDSIFKAGWSIGRSRVMRFVFLAVVVPLTVWLGRLNGGWKSFGMFVSVSFPFEN